jgi:RNA polymerase sigma-70 factor (ECF subfamily)
MPPSTDTLLKRHYQGDESALRLLLEAHLPYVQRMVRNRLGDRLRWKVETNDLVQEAVLEFLRYGPKVVLTDERHLRALLARIVQNVIGNQHEWFQRRRREMCRERPLPEDSVLELDGTVRPVTRPSEAAARAETEGLMRLALELLDPADRDVIVLREWDGLEFAAIGERLGLGPDAARMRYARALPRLAERMRRLLRGELVAAVEGADEA